MKFYFGGVVAALAVLAALIAVPRGPPSDLVLRSTLRPLHRLADYHRSAAWWSVEETEATLQLRGRIAIVTGGSSGIGKAIALGLYRRGATVILTSRSLERATAAAADLQKEAPASTRGEVEPMALDLAELSDVRRFVARFSARHATLAYLVENAGAVVVNQSLTSDGFEPNFAGNYLGHYLLLRLLLPSLKASAAPAARITATSSIAHWVHGAPLASLLPGRSRGEEPVSIARRPLGLGELMEQYGNTKLMQIHMLFELQRQLRDEGSAIAAIPVAPGLIATRMGRQGRDAGTSAAPAGSGWFFSAFVNYAISAFMALGQTPARGAQTTLHALLAPSMAGRSADGFFLQPYYTPKHRQPPLLGGSDVILHETFAQRLTWSPHLWIPHPDAHNATFGAELWAQSAAAVGLSAA